jgi:hypothetical protein
MCDPAPGRVSPVNQPGTDTGQGEAVRPERNKGRRERPTR